MPKLTGTTIVVNPETHLAEVLPAGSDLPDWAAELVGNHLLDTEPEPVTPALAEVEAEPADGAPEGATPAEVVPGDDGIPVLQPVTDPDQPAPVKQTTRRNK